MNDVTQTLGQAEDVPTIPMNIQNNLTSEYQTLIHDSDPESEPESDPESEPESDPESDQDTDIENDTNEEEPEFDDLMVKSEKSINIRTHYKNQKCEIL